MRMVDVEHLSRCSSPAETCGTEESSAERMCRRFLENVNNSYCEGNSSLIRIPSEVPNPMR